MEAGVGERYICSGGQGLEKGYRLERGIDQVRVRQGYGAGITKG